MSFTINMIWALLPRWAVDNQKNRETTEPQRTRTGQESPERARTNQKSQKGPKDPEDTRGNHQEPEGTKERRKEKNQEGPEAGESQKIGRGL